MSQPTSYEVRVQDFLTELTDHSLHGEHDMYALALHYEIPLSEAQAFARMVDRLENTFIEVSPSPQFKRNLYAELVNKPQTGMFGRVRNMPPRLRLVAALALLAAMALLGRRRFFSEARKLLGGMRGMQSDTSAASGSEAQVTSP